MNATKNIHLWLVALLLACLASVFTPTAVALGSPTGETVYIGYDTTIAYDGSQNSPSAYEDAARPPTADEKHASGAARGLLGRFADLLAAERGMVDVATAPHAGVLDAIQRGIDVPIPQGTTGIRTMMADISAITNRETALLRMTDGSRVMRLGGPDFVPLGSDVERLIAHTHPSGALELSEFDIAALARRNQKSSVLINPQDAFGVRRSVSGNW